MVFKLSLHTPVDQPTANITGVSVSPNGNFVITAGTTSASSRKMYRWDAAANNYVSIPGPTSLNYGKAYWTPDSSRVLTMIAAGTLSLYAVDQTTGALTDLLLTSGTGNDGTGNARQLVWLSNTLVASLATGNPMSLQLFELVGPDLVARGPLVAWSGMGYSTMIAALPGPLPNTIWRIMRTGLVQLLQIDPVTFATTVLAFNSDAQAIFPNIGYATEATVNSDRTLIVFGNMATNPGSPYIRVLRYDIDTNTFAWVPFGGTGSNNFPRPSLDIPQWMVGAFVSQDNAMILYASATGAAAYGVQFNEDGSDIQPLAADVVPQLTPGFGVLSGTTHLLIDSSADGRVTALGGNNAPRLRIIREKEPDALIVSRGIMGTAGVELAVAIAAELGSPGLMGTAALEASVATIASLGAAGLMGLSDMVAGQDTSGPDTIIIPLSQVPLALDGMNVRYTTAFTGRHALLDAYGPMGSASVVGSIGRYAFLDTLGIMGRADLEAKYDTAQIELDPRGLMGRASIELDLPIGARFLVDGIMGRADVAFTVPIGAFISGAGPMGDAEARVLIALEGSIDATGIMGRSSVFVVGEEDGLFQATGIMGAADVLLDYWAGPLDAVGIMGDATVLVQRTGELAIFAARGPMGEANIHIEEMEPRTGELGARGLMGSADITASIPDYAALFVTGIMGTAEIVSDVNILARFEVTGIMGQAEFVNLPGKRGDIRALGLMGRAELQGDVQSYGDIRATGLMGIATLETRNRTRRKTFFVKKPF